MIRITNEGESRKCAKTREGHYPRIEGQAAFVVPGAGTLTIGQHWSHTGGATGLSLAVSWGSHGYAGGVIDRAELIALRDYITAYLANEHKVGFAEPDDAVIVEGAVPA